MPTDTVVGTVTHIDRLPGMIELETSEGHRFSMPIAVLESSGFDCVDRLLPGDRMRLIAQPIVTYDVVRVIGMIPRPTERPRVVRDPWRRKATRKVLQHVERARDNLQDFDVYRLTEDGVLAHPHVEGVICQVARDELTKAIATIARTRGRSDFFDAAEA